MNSFDILRLLLLELFEVSELVSGYEMLNFHILGEISGKIP